MLLEISNLHVSIKKTNKEILKGVNLIVKKNEKHIIMGKNGSGKSTLGYTIMGHPNYKITEGSIKFMGQNLADLDTQQRAKLGLFLSFQNPLEIEGITNSNFLRQSLQEVTNKQIPVTKWVKQLNDSLDELNIDKSFGSRDINVGFSGGEKKRNEILQLKILKPKLAILDEIDSGLDIEATKIVGNNINEITNESDLSLIMISHYLTLPKIINATKFHIFKDGKIVKSGGIDLVKKLGYTVE
jgi:Fe-S cluster assembly ATP-binding protein